MKFRDLLFKKRYFISSLFTLHCIFTPLSYSEIKIILDTDSQSKQDQRSEYGPLYLYFEYLIKKGDKYILPARNSQGQNIYLALSCSKQKINVSTDSMTWKSWLSPSKPFEYRLINEICN